MLNKQINDEFEMESVYFVQPQQAWQKIER